MISKFIRQPSEVKIGRQLFRLVQQPSDLTFLHSSLVDADAHATGFTTQNARQQLSSQTISTLTSYNTLLDSSLLDNCCSILNKAIGDWKALLREYLWLLQPYSKHGQHLILISTGDQLYVALQVHCCFMQRAFQGCKLA